MTTDWMDEVVQALLAAKGLSEAADPETEPYKSKYAAADLLAKLRGRAECSKEGRVTSEHDAGSGSLSEGAVVRAVIDSIRGLCLVETDLLHDAEVALGAGIAVVEPLPQMRALSIRVLNALGVLCCNRDEAANAEGYLKRAVELYQQKPVHTDESTTHVLPTFPEAVLGSAHVIEEQHTLTLFYMAQVYRSLGRDDDAADLCAGTLQRQLSEAKTTFNRSDWVQNCVQLSTFYVTSRRFALAERCLQAASAVADQQRLASWPPAAAAGEGPGRGGGEKLDEDVEANLQLGWGKLYLHRLVASLEAAQQGSSEREPLRGEKEEECCRLPEHLRFSELGPESEDRLPWGAAALATSFPQALRLFNSAMPRYNAALAYYQLDGHVTDHVTILMDICNLYRCLAGMEPDLHRKCVMHRNRARRLEPLLGQLNAAVFPGLDRSIRFEMGCAYRDIADIKSEAGRLGSKVAQAAEKSKQHFSAFLDSLRCADGTLPDRIDEENEQYFVSAAVHLTRALHKIAGSLSDHKLQRELLNQSIEWCDRVVAYVRKHNLSSMAPEAELAAEMAGLLRQRLDLIFAT